MLICMAQKWLQTESDPPQKLLFLRDRNTLTALSVPQSSLLLSTTVKGRKAAPYIVKAPSCSVYTRNLIWPSSCSLLVTKQLPAADYPSCHVKCPPKIAVTLGETLLPGRMLPPTLPYSIPVGF